jgi:aryl-alcohol dehydrogenase-like predicted oxidoreductase
MRVSVECGVACVDLSPPLVNSFKMLQDETNDRVAFTFVIRKPRIEAVIVGVSSTAEAKQTFSTFGADVALSCGVCCAS